MKKMLVMVHLLLLSLSNLGCGSGGDSDSDSTVADAGADSIPDQFSFIDLRDADLSATMTSNPILVSDVEVPVSISISNGLYSINGGAFTADDGLVENGDSVSVQLTSAATYATTTQSTLTIASVSDTFTITTLSLPGPPTEFQLDPLDGGDPAFTSTHFSGSQNCAQCHDGISDSNGTDVSIVTDWSSSIMANSVRDPFWRAKLSSELQRSPGLADIINEACTRCHAPMANEEMRVNDEHIEVLGSGGLLDASHPRHDAAMEGVSCTLCHQIGDSPELGTTAGFSGEFEINDQRIAYGPYSNLITQPMVNATGYTPAFSEHMRESEMCATCHNLKTPTVDEFGNIINATPGEGFPEQMPYSEWLHSDFAGQQSCQDCHLSRSNGVIMSTRPQSLATVRDNFAIHDFIGANILMLDILDNNRERLGVLANDFAETIAKTRTMLESSANVTVNQASLVDDTLEFNVHIESQTGHKLPTSYPSRRLIVHATVRDASGSIVFESGRVNADGSIEGLDADGDATRYEPHHDLITSAGQVQVYEAIMADNHGAVTYTLLRGQRYQKDNRLLPLGFDKATAPADIEVIGTAQTDLDFTAGSDQVTYRIGGLNGTRYAVEVELIYQPIAYAFLRDLLTDATPEVDDFRLMYDQSEHKSTVLATTRAEIAL